MIDIAALVAGALGRPLMPDEAVAVAVSGGPDSLALLDLCMAAMPGRVTALTVDHGLRSGSDQEAASVAAQCAARGIPHRLLAWKGPRPVANLQAGARAARYQLLGQWCVEHGVPFMLTAHHADDQAETLLMRLNRASGVTGLAGIRGKRALPDGVTVLRPLLGIRRAALAEIVRQGGWVAVNDPSNSDERFDRTAARHLLAESGWLDSPALARSARHLAAADAALAWAADRAWQGNVRHDGKEWRLDAAGLPDEIRLRVVGRILAALVPGSAARGSDVAAMVARLDAGETATLAGVQGRGGAVWRFHIMPPHRENP